MLILYYALLLLYGVQGLPVAFHCGSFAQIIHSYTTTVVIITHSVVKMLHRCYHRFILPSFLFLLPSHARPAVDAIISILCPTRNLYYLSIISISSRLPPDIPATLLRCFSTFSIFPDRRNNNIVDCRHNLFFFVLLDKNVVLLHRVSI